MNTVMIERYVNDRTANLRAEAAHRRLVRQARLARRGR